MTCQKCGATIAEKAIVCYRCGAPTAIPAAPERPARTGGGRRFLGAAATIAAATVVELAAVFVPAVAPHASAFLGAGAALDALGVFLAWRALRVD